MTVRIPTPGSNAERSRAYNRGLVLEHIRNDGAAGRAEIARTSGLSIQAVSNIIADLVREGWLYEAGRREGQRGLPAMTYAIRASAATALGLEIRPGALLGALIDLEGRVHFSERLAVPQASPERILPLAAEMLGRAVGRAGQSRAALIGAGVVMPGPFGATGLSGGLTDLPGWDRIDAEAILSEALGTAVTVENDANAAAMAERVSGVARGLSTYAYLYFGTGLGLGIVADGALYRGAFGNAGEIGHVPVATADGPRALEEVAGRIALGRALAAAGLPSETIEDLERAHAARSAAYLDWLRGSRAALGHAIHVLENLLDPVAIILGGAMPGPILTELADATDLPQRSVSHRPDRVRPRVMPGTAGRMTATVGAAALVVNTFLSPRLAVSA